MTSFDAMNLDLGDIYSLVVEQLAVAITVTDLDGRIVYFNPYSAEILDRKPEYIGRDIRQCHNEPDSIRKIDHILEEFKRGGSAEFHYEASRGDRDFMVNVHPLKKNGHVIGCIHSVIVKKSN